MIPYKLPAAAGAVLSVTTVKSLQDAIRTAASSTTYEIPQDADAIDIYVESGAFRVSFDEVDPTAAAGFLIPTTTFRAFRGPKLSKMKIVSTSGTAVMSVMIGRSVPGLVDA